MTEAEVQTLKRRLLFQERLDEFLESAGSRRVGRWSGHSLSPRSPRDGCRHRPERLS